jgi:hypothetical protein
VVLKNQVLESIVGLKTGTVTRFVQTAEICANGQFGPDAGGDEDKRVHDIVTPTFEWSPFKPHSPRSGCVESISRGVPCTSGDRGRVQIPQLAATILALRQSMVAHSGGSRLSGRHDCKILGVCRIVVEMAGPSSEAL